MIFTEDVVFCRVKKIFHFLSKRLCKYVLPKESNIFVQWEKIIRSEINDFQSVRYRFMKSLPIAGAFFPLALKNADTGS